MIIGYYYTLFSICGLQQRWNYWKADRGIIMWYKYRFIQLLRFIVIVFGFITYCRSDVTTVGADEYDTYRPKVNQDSIDGFIKLQEINPEVIGWLNIYGTHIDYPLLQTTDNKKYLDTDAKGNYSILGSVFMDYRCNPNFSDFNTIIYGHHTPSGVIFGDIKKFATESFFNSHRYGSIYYNGKEKGLEIFGIMEANAYDTEIYQPSVTGEIDQKSYYQYLLSKAKYTRNSSISSEDHIVLLSTCFVDVTNGRHILLAKITDEVHKNSFEAISNKGSQSYVYQLFYRLAEIPTWVVYLIALLLFFFVVIIFVLILLTRKSRGKRIETSYDSSNDNKLT